MKKFLISVNGTQYEVDVEEITGSQETVAATQINEQKTVQPVAVVKETPVATATIPKPVAKPAPVSAKTGSEVITCPMPGTILKVLVTVGQAVTKNQVLCVLEAMKMENEIVASRDGVVAGVMVSRGMSVNAGDSLLSLE